MATIATFVGHSFDESDAEIVRKFTSFFNEIQSMGIGFLWEHAEEAEARVLSQKVKEKMRGKNTFIGICTAREYVCEPNAMKRCIVARGMVKMKASAPKPKASDWIIQEIGFAVARDMQILLLIESGLRMPGGIQGDIEYIEFPRNSPENAFTKLLQMIKSLRPKTPSGGSESSLGEERASSRRIEADLEVQGTKLEVPAESWDSSDYSRALARAILDMDRDREGVIFNEYKARLGQDADKRVDWEAQRLFLHHVFAKENVLEELRELEIRHPNNRLVKAYLGRVHVDYGLHGAASSYFTAAAKIARDDKERLNDICAAAIAFVKDGNTASVEAALSQARQTATAIREGGEILLRCLIDMAKETDDTDIYLAGAEGLLHMKPEDHECRFSLAYRYAEIGEEALSLYHYRILASKNPSEVIWNNIGVAADHLKMPIKSVEAYHQSEKLGGTLSLSNLAHKLLDAGFVAEADEICQKALKSENYDKQIGTAISRIKEDPKKEEENERSLLENTAKKRAFLVEFALACTRPSPLECEGTWHASKEDVHLVVKDGTFTASSRVEDSTLMLASLLSGLVGPAEKSLIVIRYEGRLHGKGVVYSRWEENKKMDSQVTGLMYFADDLNTLHVYQRGTGSSERFYEMVRGSEPNRNVGSQP